MAFEVELTSSGQIWGRAARAVGLALLLTLAACSKPKPTGTVEARASGETRPNILVIEVDHLGLELGAYGDKAAQTPEIDRLAREGVTFTDAYATSGGADAEAVALLTGMHPSTIGMVQEWTGAPQWTVAPPPEVRGYPELLRAAGYYTFHIGTRPDAFGSPPSLWSQDVTAADARWIADAAAQPFLGVVDLTVEDRPAAEPRKKSFLETLQFWKRDESRDARPVTDAARLQVPAYLPDTPEVRAQLKAEYDRVHRVDEQVGALMKRLESAGLLKTTVVVFTAKAGPERPRAERTVYDSGVRVPLIVRFPDGRGKGVVRHDLISGADFAPSILKLAGVQPMAWMQGRDRFSGTGDPNRFVITVQDRVDGVYERAFAVRDGRYLYVLNLAPDTQVAAMMRPGPMTDAVQAANKAGRLSAPQAQIFGLERASAELYDLKADPFQLRNLAEEPAHAGDVSRLSQALNAFATSAPDWSIYSAEELQDRFKPGGVTPTAAAPTAALRDGKLLLDSVTPGAAILWRVKGEKPWRLYAGPAVLKPGSVIEAKSVRYGFLPSALTELKP